MRSVWCALSWIRPSAPCRGTGPPGWPPPCSMRPEPAASRPSRRSTAPTGCRRPGRPSAAPAHRRRRALGGHRLAAGPDPSRPTHRRPADAARRHRPPCRAGGGGGRAARCAAERAATTVLRPGPLGVGATTALIRGALGDPVDAGLVLACHEVAEGNPLLLRALHRSLRDAGVAPTADGVAAVRARAPEIVAAFVLPLLRQLPSPAVAVARALAVLGPGAPLRARRRPRRSRARGRRAGRGPARRRRAGARARCGGHERPPHSRSCTRCSPRPSPRT